MTLKEAGRILNAKLRKKNPETFSSTWVYKNAPSVYMYTYKNLRTQNSDIDWDSLTTLLDKRFQKRWIRYRKRKIIWYENGEELHRILSKYQPKLYTFITLHEKGDKEIRHKIIVALVRVAQKGNVLARNELTTLLMFTVETWIEKYSDRLYKWKSHRDQIEEKIHLCIRGYRYTGSFISYLFRTLELSGRGLRYFRTYSLDTPLFDGETTIIDYVVQDAKTQEYHLFERI